MSSLVKMRDDGSEALMHLQALDEQIEQMAVQTEEVVKALKELPPGLSDTLSEFIPRLESIAKVTTDMRNKGEIAINGMRRVVQEEQQVREMKNAAL